MPPFRNTPMMGAIAKVAFALIASVASIPSEAVAQAVSRAGTPTEIISTNSGNSGLRTYYKGIERQLLSRGYLRRDRRPGRLAPEDLARNFMAIAMRSEYSLNGGGLSRSGREAPLRRWEKPVRIGVHFGASADAKQRAADLSAVRKVASRLQKASRHPVAVADSAVNFHILVLNDQERGGVKPFLREIAPTLSSAARNAILRMPPNVFCMVVAIPGKSRLEGYQQAIAVVRSEHPPTMRQSCMEEELAQGMGLANDSPEAWPSIFNDDEEFGVLTQHDELLLRMLYDDSLRPGMNASAVAGKVSLLAQALLNSG
ncbi:DUF2927 domain-containing protein [Aliiroseovarius sp.]|uniref:DUF2927 domain-containing protein n=1 Tax=Aliiroseovarius sp. TaxID=1872442 RepID=UPI00262E2CA8|nr:DUF2927 domain-containing protein [Aliiroseovarius sp.]